MGSTSSVDYNIDNRILKEEAERKRIFLIEKQKIRNVTNLLEQFSESRIEYLNHCSDHKSTEICKNLQTTVDRIKRNLYEEVQNL